LSPKEQLTGKQATIGNNVLLGFQNQVKSTFALAALHILRKLTAPTPVLEEQVLLQVRLACLPKLPTFYVGEISQVYQLTRNSVQERLLCVNGVVDCVWLPEFRIAGQIFECRNVECRNKSRLHVNTLEASCTTKRDQDGKRLKQSTRMGGAHLLDQICSACGVKMEELITDRTFSTRQKIRVVERGIRHTFANTLTGILEDDLVNSVHVGDEVEMVVGAGRLLKLRPDKTEYDNGLVALINNISLPNPPTYTLSPAIQALLDMKLSPWSYLQRLVDCFCRDVCPHVVWRRVKLALLFSLVSLPTYGFDVLEDNDLEQRPTDVSPAIHIALHSPGCDSRLWLLMECAAGFRRHARWNATGSKRRPSLVQVEKDRIVRGGLSDAIGGVLLVDGDGLNKADALHLMQVMEVPHPLPLVQGNSLVPYSQEAIVWCVMSASGKTRKLIWSGMEGKSSCVLRVRPTQQASQVDLQVSEHVLLQAMGLDPYQHRGKPIYPDISKQDFEGLIHIGANLHVIMGPECKSLIQEYFLVLRKAHALMNETFQGKESMFTIMDALVRLSMASARLCLRSETIVDDAVVACLLVEESVSVRQGTTSFMGFGDLSDDGENVKVLFQNAQALLVDEHGQTVEDPRTMQSVCDGDDACINNFYDALCKVLERHRLADAVEV
jgi:hypothetical protein